MKLFLKWFVTISKSSFLENLNTFWIFLVLFGKFVVI